jgi:hypothetical protein
VLSDRGATVAGVMWTEDAPTHCPRGHQLGPDRVLVGWDAGRAGSLDHGHRIHICRTCDTVIPWTPTCSWQ